MGRRFVVVGVAAALACVAPLIAAPPAGAATFDVTSGADDGSEGTLRWAVAQAVATPGDDVVVVDPSITAITLDDCGAGGRLDVTSPDGLTIDGNGTTITQTCDDRVIGGAGDLLLRDLTLTGGYALDEGGGIRFDGPLELDEVAVRGNAAVGGGGGVFGTELTMTDSSISENIGEGVLVLGGGAVAITRSTVVDNLGTGVSTQGALVVVDSEVSRNHAGPNGGGISVQDAGSVRVERSRIEGNRTDDDGGGIYAVVAVEVVDSVLAGNHAEGGGGIWSWVQVTVSGSVVQDNVAQREGGGIIGGIEGIGSIEVVDSSVSGNQAGDGFGGIYGPGAVTLTGSSVQGNATATSLAGVTGGDVVLTRSVVSGNQAADEGAGVVGDDVVLDTSTVSGNASTTRGGVFAYESLTLRNATVTENAPVNVEAKGLDAFGSVVARGATGDCDLGGDPVTSRGYNFGGDASCGFDQATDTNAGGDPLLSPLAFHEGPTENRVPESGSPLLNAIPSSDARCTGTDQRGFPRPANGACDIGAVEVRQVSAVGTSVTTPFQTAVATDLVPLVTDPDLVLSNYEVTPPANGSLDPEDGGVVTYHPDAGFSGADSYTYVVCSTGDVICTSVETVSITVLAGPVAAATPVAATPTFTG